MNENRKFDVPYNWDTNIIQFYIDNKDYIKMVYGRADDWFPQWRKINNWVHIFLEDIYLQNKKLNKNWIKSNYLLNWTSLLIYLKVGVLYPICWNKKEKLSLS
jgi:hypothetical protein